MPLYLSIISVLLSSLCLVQAGGPRVKTKFGVVEGSYKTSEPGSRKFSAFEGLPYAQPPFARRPNDGFCDDGGAGSETTDCAFGSDCLGA